MHRGCADGEPEELFRRLREQRGRAIARRKSGEYQRRKTRGGKGRPEEGEDGPPTDEQKRRQKKRRERERQSEDEDAAAKPKRARPETAETVDAEAAAAARDADDGKNDKEGTSTTKTRALAFLALPRLPTVSAKGWSRLAGAFWDGSGGDVDGGMEVLDFSRIVWCDDEAAKEAGRKWWNVAVCTLDARGRAIPLAFCRNFALLKALNRSTLNLPSWLLFRGRYRITRFANETSPRTSRPGRRDKNKQVGQSFSVDVWDAISWSERSLPGDLEETTTKKKRIKGDVERGRGRDDDDDSCTETKERDDKQEEEEHEDNNREEEKEEEEEEEEEENEEEKQEDDEEEEKEEEDGDERGRMRIGDFADACAFLSKERIERLRRKIALSDPTAIAPLPADREVAPAAFDALATGVLSLDQKVAIGSSRWEEVVEDGDAVAPAVASTAPSSLEMPDDVLGERASKRVEDETKRRLGEELDDAVAEYRRRKALRTYGIVGGRDSRYVGRWHWFPRLSFCAALKREYSDLDDALRPGYRESVLRFAAGLPPANRPSFLDWQRLDVADVVATSSCSLPLSSEGRHRSNGRRCEDDLPLAVLQYREADGGYSFVACDAAGLLTLVKMRASAATFSEVYQGVNGLWATAIPIDHDQKTRSGHLPIFPGRDGDDAANRSFAVRDWQEQATSVVVEALTRTWPCMAEAQRDEGCDPLVRMHVWIADDLQKMLLREGDDRSTRATSPSSSVVVDKISLHASAQLPANAAIVDFAMLSVVWKTMRAVVEAQPRRFAMLCDADGRCLLDCDGLQSLRLPRCSKRLDDGRLVRRLLPLHPGSTVLDACVHYPHAVPPLTGPRFVDRSLFLRRDNSAASILWKLPGGAAEIVDAARPSRLSLEAALDAARRRFGISFRARRTTATTEDAVHLLTPASKTERDCYCPIKDGRHAHPKMFLMFVDDRLWIHCHSANCKKQRAAIRPAPHLWLAPDGRSVADSLDCSFPSSTPWRVASGTPPR